MTTSTDLAECPLTPLERWRSYLLCLLGWMFDFYDLMMFAYIARAISNDPQFNWGDEYKHNKALLVLPSLTNDEANSIHMMLQRPH